MIKVLVTGGAGFIGSMLAPFLYNAGYEVTVFDNFMYGQTPFNRMLLEKDFHVIKGDVRNVYEYKKQIQKADIIIPLAALVGAPLCERNPDEAVAINYSAIRNLSDFIRGDQLIIIPITNSGYGVGEKGKFCTEETPMRPVSHYGVLKVAIEDLLLNVLPNNAVSLRLATVFGASPRMRLDLLVNEFVYRAYHDRAITLFEAHFKRNYIHVRDVVGAFTFAINNFDKMKGQAFNVGLSDANLSKMELCERIKLQLPKFVFMEAPIGEDPDKRDYIVSNEKIEKMGFRTKVSLDEGIEELISLFGHMKIPNPYGNI